VRYELLGPLRVVDGNSVTSVRAQKAEILLAALLARPNQVVTGDQLMHEMWGDQPPRRATAGLHVYVSELRKFLKRAGWAESPIVTHPLGYLLHVDAGELDYRCFLDRTDAGRVSLREQRYAEAARHLEHGLDLWHGRVLGGVGEGPILHSFATWLAEVQMDATQMLMDAQLQMGRHRELVGVLYGLTSENPLCEGFYRQLMLALYRSQRRGDALKVYQLARKTLRDELGLEPDLALQELHQAILLADDRRLEVSAAG
jgi:SARP family transcriptional regulator, regulator of embCAB operon